MPTTSSSNSGRCSLTPPTDWGIRNQKFLLSADGRHLLANAPVVRVTPDVIVMADHVDRLDDDHQLRLKTWMGLRYDCPAVPSGT